MTGDSGDTTRTAPCPKCGVATGHTRPAFMAWGGKLGPERLNLAICSNCGAGFNAETGKSNTVPIVVYAVVVFAILITIITLI